MPDLTDPHGWDPDVDGSFAAAAAERGRAEQDRIEVEREREELDAVRVQRDIEAYSAGAVVERMDPATYETRAEDMRALVDFARRALSQPGAVVKVAGGGEHVTITPLETLAGIAGITVVESQPECDADPLHEGHKLARVSVTVVRPDGVSRHAWGVASTAEGRWSDWFALSSMASTRGRVRALTHLLMPVLRVAHLQATGRTVSSTPAELMPDDR